MARLLLVLMLLYFSPLCASCAQTVGQKPQPVEDFFLPGGDRIKVEVWIEELKIPWSLLFLPDGRALVGRPVNLRGLPMTRSIV